MKILFALALSLLVLLTIPLLLSPVLAITDPLSVTNNKFGIHIISPTSDEASQAASLVNSSGGDWGYVTLVIEDKDKDVNKWQNFFNTLTDKHLIPIVRIATHPADGAWVSPTATAALAWADFLNQLTWPIKNRYVLIYNEPNHGAEWGGNVNPDQYATILSLTIDALKSRSSDFFVLNGSLDASSPQQLPELADEIWFLQKMNEAVPGIFNKLDGWSSHSYPNPNFAGLPTDSGRGSIKTYQWELETLKSLGLAKNLPVFITETGWKHQGDQSFFEELSNYYQAAFTQSWTDPNIVAITPFLLNYLEPPFNSFSFLGPQGQIYPFYTAVQSLPKLTGQPQLNLLPEVKGIDLDLQSVDLKTKEPEFNLWTFLTMVGPF
ncbi:MAG: hypothetical protein HYW45_04070 [Candidatus Daviesbacteria bacterium]|nr:MAG: hypothetical protein HYW45_04070 [Candidatus Daviesbacteria bacterium]